MKPSVLVVEDDVVLNQMLVRALSKAGYEMGSARSWAEARAKLDAQAPDVVLLDMNLPDAQNLGPLGEIASDRPTIILTAYGSIDHAVRAMRMGAADYLVKPVNLDELELVIRRALDGNRLRAGRAVDHAASAMRRTPDMLGDSPAMKRLRELIAAVADTQVTVLITAGLIEAAAGGTLFLDEIGDIGPALQAKLLRVIETGRFRRVGATADLRADVRIVAATNRHLQRMVQQGQFRADLYYRLSVFAIEVPALRERREDIDLLVQHFAQRSAPRAGTAAVFSGAALQMLRRYHWPGNVRELRNVVERAVLLAGAGAVVEPHHLPALHGEGAGATASGASDVAALLEGEPTLEDIERRYLALLLERYGGNRRRVAEVLGVSERTAYRMLERFEPKPHRQTP